MAEKNKDKHFKKLLVYCRWCSIPACDHYVYHTDGICPEKEATRVLAVSAAVDEEMTQRDRD